MEVAEKEGRKGGGGRINDENTRLPPLRREMKKKKK
jgi:hypothetical protein